MSARPTPTLRIRTSVPIRAAFPIRAALPIALLLAATACGGEGSAGGGGPEVVRETVGDTLVVRTRAGSVWGGNVRLVPEIEIGVLEGAEEYMFGQVASLGWGADGSIYVVDRQVPALRVYDPDGQYRATWGREGGGPGEFAGPDGGLATLEDGRVVVRDPGNARLQVFDADGTPLDTWPVIPGGFNTSNPMHRTADGVLYTPTVMDLEVDISEWRTGLIRVDSDGTVLDTVPVPEVHENAFVEARVEGSVSRNTVPFSPGEHWSVHPDGFFVHGVADEYSFTLLREGSPLRIERTTEPVPVTAGERRQAEARTTQSLRRTDPNWRWNGPGIPDVKPAFRELYTASDGRIWVQRHGPGVEGDDPNYDPDDPESVEMRWREPVLFDVFQDDGTFLGTAVAPDEFSSSPTPVFAGDRVLAVTRDDLGVQRVVVFRLEGVGPEP